MGGLFRSPSRFLRLCCIVLHLFLLALQGALLITWAFHAEHRIVVSPTASGAVANLAGTISLVFITIYSVILLLLTQQVAVRCLLVSRQTLTATHDISNAWNGLGSMALSLWRQIFLPASALGTLQVALYLMCLSVLHITTRALFTMELFDEAGRAVVPTTVGMPQFVNVTGDQNSTVSNDVWTSVTELLPYLSLVDYERTIGLYKGTLYDVPKSGLGNVSVGAVAANVSCGFLPNITALGTQDINIWDMNVSIQWDVQAWWRQPTANFGLLFNLHTILWPGVIQQVAYLDAGTTPMMPREMIFILTTNISDSNGDLNSTIPLPSDHAMCIVMNDVKTCVESLSVIGCTLSWLNQTAIVNAQEGALASVQPSGEKSSSVWNLWTPKTPSNTFFDPQVDTWGNMLANSAFSSTVIDGFSVANSTDPGSFSAVYGYLTEQYLLKELGMSPNTSSNIMLHQIENALANLTAALYWASANLLPPNTTQAYVSLLSGATVAAQTASRLNLNLLPIAVGFGCSTVLLFLAVQFTHGMNESTPRIGSIGVLQLIWLTHEQPAIQELVATVNQPTTENLRSVGMLKIGTAQQNRPNGYAD